MAAIRWYRIPIGVGSWQREIFVYETDSHLFDLQYHWMYTSGMANSIDAILRDFREEFVRSHAADGQRLDLVTGEPVEVPWSVVQAARPRNQPRGYFDPPSSR